MAVRKFVLLVAGHAIGGDPGAVAQGSTEAKENVQIVDRIYDLLAPHPNILVERVPHNLDYVASVKWANALYTDLNDGIVVEVHKNSASVKASGNEVLIPAGSDTTSYKLANSILNQVNVQTGLPNRGVKERGDLYLIQAINMYACLVECGFINNDPINDEWDNKWATGIANGVCDFFNESRPNAPKPEPVPQPTPVIKPPVVAPPAPKPEPAPAEPNYSKENNTLLKQILDLLKGLITKLTNIFKF